MTGHGFGRGDCRAVVAEDFTDRTQLFHVAYRRRSTVRVQVVDWGVNAVHRHLHAAHRAFTGWRNHVGAVRRCTVAHDLSIDVRATCQRVLQLFNHNHTAAARDNETVTVRIVGTGGFVRGLIVLGGQCAHRVEFTGHFPAQLFAAASKYDVLFTQLDLLNSVTDTVCGGRTRGADGVVHTVDFERGRQARGNRRTHGFRDHVRTYRFQTTRATHGVSTEYLRFR